MPSAVKVDIWNRALDRIGETETIEDEEEDRLAAAVCRRHYDDCLGEVLEDFPWPFAKGQAQLAELAGVTRAGWAHVYAVPDDFVAARAILMGGQRIGLTPGESRIPYEVQSNDAGDGQVLCSDADFEDADAFEYTRRIETVSAFPRLFVSALAWRLAAELAMAVRKDMKLADGCLRGYHGDIGRAFTSQLRGNQEDPEPEASSIRARR
jgi:hypothetical protein